MSKFYGQVCEPSGNRTTATRCGHKAIKVSAQSYDGSVQVELNYDSNGELCVWLGYNEGSSAMRHTLFYGSFEDFINKLKG